MSVTVDEILNAARVGAASLTGETAGYLVLSAADGVSESSGRLLPSGVLLAEDGTLIAGRLAVGSAVDLEADLRALLARMLSHSRQGVPALLRVARPMEATEARGIVRLVGEIEAALIPVNRSAARRALSRLHRDVVRAKAAGKLLSEAPEPIAAPENPVLAVPVVPAAAIAAAVAATSMPLAASVVVSAASSVARVEAAVLAEPVAVASVLAVASVASVDPVLVAPATLVAAPAEAVPVASGLPMVVRPRVELSMVPLPPGAELAHALRILAEADLEPAPPHEPARVELVASAPNRHPSAPEADPPIPRPTPPDAEAPFVEAPPPSRVFGSRPPTLPLPEPVVQQPEPTPVVVVEAEEAEVDVVEADVFQEAAVEVFESAPEVLEASVYEPEATPFLRLVARARSCRDGGECLRMAVGG